MKSYDHYLISIILIFLFVIIGMEFIPVQEAAPEEQPDISESASDSFQIPSTVKEKVALNTVVKTSVEVDD